MKKILKEFDVKWDSGEFDKTITTDDGTPADEIDKEKVKSHLAKELHLQKEEIKQIIIADDEEFVSEDVRQARNRMKESIINKL